MLENHISLKGMYRDVLTGPERRIVYDSGWRSNTIVRSCRMLLAGFMKNDSAPPQGIQYIAVGQGKPEWDMQWNTPAPPGPALDTVTGLESPFPQTITVPPVNPLPGQQYLDIVYLDESDKVVENVTNRLQVKCTLEPGFPTADIYPLREFGLFGKFGGDTYMINCVRHPVIYKDALATLVREIKLYF